ncbi:Epsin-2 (EPS-15-interacting protein 2) [Durusdinium trenchii]|uniref:Epsin-2 (EPS-15-interacting protein 2) n=1 Tax=Durusdinium trenchii TaxID=1381693 RepID=A0ABP0RAZ1_9DINO
MILKHGSERAIQDVRRDAWRIQQWKEFRYMEEGKDVGSGIRSKSSAILEMLADEELLTEEKEKAEKLKQKMTSAGVGGGSEPISKEGGGSAFKSPFDRDRRRFRRKKQPEESPQSSPASPGGADGDTSQMISQFMSVTNASRIVAKESLERHNWDLHNAVMQYLASETSPGPPSLSRPNEKPGWTERKSRVDQVVSITKVRSTVIGTVDGRR